MGEIKDRLNQEVLVSKDTLEDEMARIQAYLYIGMNPEEYQVDIDNNKKLEAYLDLLGNYQSAMGNGENWDDYIAKVVDLSFNEPEDVKTYHFETALEKAELPSGYNDLEQPYRDQFINEYREEFINSPDRYIGSTISESEVTYFRGANADRWNQELEIKELEKEKANYKPEFIRTELLNKTVNFAVDKLGPVSTVADFYRGLSDYNADIQELETLGSYQAGKNENERDMKIGDALESADGLDAAIQISERPVLGSGPKELEVKIEPTNRTFNIINRWEQVKGMNPNIPYDDASIQRMDWAEIEDFLDRNKPSFDEINTDLRGYILHNELGDHDHDDKTVEEVID